MYNYFKLIILSKSRELYSAKVLIQSVDAKTSAEIEYLVGGVCPTRSVVKQVGRKVSFLVGFSNSIDQSPKKVST